MFKPQVSLEWVNSPSFEGCLRKPESALAEEFVARNVRVVAVVGQPLRHAPGALLLLDRVVEGQYRHVLLAADRVDQAVQLADLRIGGGIAVVPRQDVDQP